MIVFLICLAFSADQDITICYNSCPNSIEGKAFKIYSSDDISSLIKDFLSDTKTNIYFYNATEFTFLLNLEIFQGHTVEFYKLVNSSKVSIEIDCTDSIELTESLIFKDIDVSFYSPLATPQLQLKNLEIENTNINLFSISPKLVVESLISDNSIQVFSSVDIYNGSSSSSEIILDTGSTPSLSIKTIDNGAILAYNQKTTTFSFAENLDKKRFEIKEATFCEIECACSENSKLIQISINNINNLHFLGTWPNSALIDITNTGATNLCANSTVLPVSLKNSEQATITITQSETIITGEFNSPIIFTQPENVQQNRKTVTFSNSFGGSSIDLGSSFYDFTINKLTTDISGTGNFPFVFKVGKGGVSTLTVLSASQTTTGKNGLTINRDFTSHLSDDDLSNLISKKWSILTLTGVTFSSTHISAELETEPFIHGFVKGDSCMNFAIEGNQVVLSATSPSLLPLNVCYDGNKEAGQCNLDESIRLDSIDSISSFVVDGINKLKIHLKVSQLDLFDMKKFDQMRQDFQVSLIGYGEIEVNSIQMNENSGITDLALKNLAIGTTVFTVKTVTFDGCKSKESSTFSFKNCDKINCDDDFVNFIAPHMSVSDGKKIKTVSLKMNKFNAITIADSKFIFYQLTLRSQTELSRDLFDFLDAFYNVGNEKSNSLNLTMQTQNPPSFNVTFVNDLETLITTVPELVLFSWSQTKEADFKTYFMFNQIDSKIILTSKYKPKQLIPIGTGIFSYETKFYYGTSICSTLDSDKGICPKDSIYVSYDKLNDKIHEVNDENVIVYIKSQSNNFPYVDLHNVNNKLTLFNGLSTDLTDCIEISSSESFNIEFTEITMKHLIVKKASIQNTKQLILGNMKFYDVEVDSSFKDVDLTVNEFVCQFDHLSKFKTVSVMNNLLVNGSISNEQSTVQINNNEISNPLIASIESDATLHVGEKFIKIGESKFVFNSLRNENDAALDFEQNVMNVQINKDEEASESMIPKIEIRKSSEASFTFSNNWKPDSTKRVLFSFSHLINKNNKIILTGQNTPISISAKDEITFISKAEKSGIVGPIEFQDFTSMNSINVLYEKVSKSTVFVSQKISVGKNVNIKFSQPNIIFDVAEICSQKEEESTIHTELFSNLDGDSCLIINEKLKNVKISSVYKIQIPITTENYDQKFRDYYTNNHLLIKANPKDAENATPKSISLIGTKPTSQGIFLKNIEIKVDEIKGEISMKLKKNPLNIPLTFCYEIEDNDLCQFKLTDSNIDKFSDLIDSKSNVIEFIFGKENKKPLNLNVDKIKGLTVLINQENEKQLTVQIQLGSGIVSLLSLNKVYAKVLDESTFNVDRIELSNGAKFDDLEKAEIINVEYKSVWKELELKPTEKTVILNLTDCKILTFTSDGIIVDSDSSIPYSKYPNVTVQLDSKSETVLESSDDMTQFKGTVIYSETNRFILGSKWSTNSMQSKIQIIFGKYVNTHDIFVSTLSYPFVQFPQLMSANTIQIDPSVLPYKTPEDVTFDNIISQLDFSHIKDDKSKSKIFFKSITFKGYSSISVKGIEKLSKSEDDYFPLNFQNIDIVESSFVTINDGFISDSLIVRGNSTLVGNFEIEQKVTMKWNLNEIPKINFYTSPNKLPQSIIFEFNGKSIKGKEGEFDEFLYGKSFEIIKIKTEDKCNELRSKLKFVSDSVDSFGAKSIFDSQCNNGNLILYGARKINEKEGSSGGKKNVVIIVVVIVVVVVIIAAVVIGLLIFIKSRKNPNADTASSLALSKNLLEY